jgi:hypothetical protein
MERHESLLLLWVIKEQFVMLVGLMQHAKSKAGTKKLVLLRLGVAT